MTPSLPTCPVNDTGVPEIEHQISENELLDPSQDRLANDTLETNPARSEEEDEEEEKTDGVEGSRRGSSDVMHDDMKIMYPKGVCSIAMCDIYKWPFPDDMYW